jgi:hypothetical protein
VKIWQGRAEPLFNRDFICDNRSIAHLSYLIGFLQTNRTFRLSPFFATNILLEVSDRSAIHLLAELCRPLSVAAKKVSDEALPN